MDYQPHPVIKGESELSDEHEHHEEHSDSELLHEIEKKPRTIKMSKRALKARRAIEDELEKKKMRKEIDYLFDEHFTDEKDNE